MKYLFYFVFVFFFFKIWRDYQQYQILKKQQDEKEENYRQALFQLETDYLNQKISEQDYQKQLKALEKQFNQE